VVMAGPGGSSQPAVDFTGELMAAGRRALLRMLNALCARIDAAESSILRPQGDADLVFFASTNPTLVAAGVPKVPIGGSFAGIVCRTGQMVAVADAERQPGQFGGIDTVVGRATREYAALPIAAGTALLGVLTVVNRPAAAEQGTRPFSVDELRMAQQAADALVGPVAILDSLDHGPALSDRDGLRGAFGDEFVADLMALNEPGRRAVQSGVAALLHHQQTERP
jgi:GAF domain-containing protein